MKSTQVLFAILAVAFTLTAAQAQPYDVGTTPKETNWNSWGYQVDGQGSANWFAVDISWDTETAMSGNHLIQEDFLFRVDPATVDTSEQQSSYNGDFWNHDDVRGLGEFFDAGLSTNDQNYYLELSLGTTDTWAVWYDADRDQIDDGGSEHAILAGTVSSYWNRDGYFYGVLVEDDGVYDGYFTDTHDEGQPDVVNGTYHAGHGDPIPEPATLALLGAGGLALFRRRRERRGGVN